MNSQLTSTTELVKVLQAGSGRIYGRPSGPSDGVPCGFWDHIDTGADENTRCLPWSIRCRRGMALPPVPLPT